MIQAAHLSVNTPCCLLHVAFFKATGILAVCCPAGAFPQLHYLFFGQAEVKAGEEVLQMKFELCTRRYIHQVRKSMHASEPVLNGLSCVSQVMSPMRKASGGVLPLNAYLQTMLNPAAPEKAELSLPKSYSSGFDDRSSPVVLREGDRVIQCSNNYQKDVFNGDIGFVTKVNKATRELSVQYQGESAGMPQTAIARQLVFLANNGSQLYPLQ